MMAFVDTSPEDLLHWNLQTLTFLQASSDPEAKKWEGSVQQNVGYSLHQVGRFAEALEHFDLSRKACELRGDTRGARISRWMTAWTFRSLQRYQEAIAMQLQLEQEFAADGEPDPYVFEELIALYEAVGETANAALYKIKLQATAKTSS